MAEQNVVTKKSPQKCSHIEVKSKYCFKQLADIIANNILQTVGKDGLIAVETQESIAKVK